MRKMRENLSNLLCFFDMLFFNFVPKKMFGKNDQYLTKQTLQIARPYLRELTGQRMSLGYHFCLSIGLLRVCDPDISKETRETQVPSYFMQSDFFKGTKYEELTTLGSGIS